MIVDFSARYVSPLGRGMSSNSLRTALEDVADDAGPVVIGEDKDVALGRELDVEVAQTHDSRLTVEDGAGDDLAPTARVRRDGQHARVARGLRLSRDVDLDTALGRHEPRVDEIHGRARRRGTPRAAGRRPPRRSPAPRRSWRRGAA